MNTVCDICKSDKYKIFTTYPEFKGKVVKCRDCGFVYVIPKPDYKTCMEICTVSFKDRNLEELARKKSMAKKRINFQIISCILTNSPTKRGRLLDVGCNLGYFLDIARNYGFETLGIDIIPAVIEYVKAKGHNAFCSPLSQLKKSNYYDIVTVLEVLEHMPYPSSEIKGIWRILKNNGLVVIEVPNVTFHLLKGKFERLVGKQVVGLNPKIHFNHFTPATLKRILDTNGFQVLGIYVGRSSSIKPEGWNNLFIQVNHILQLFLNMIFRLTNIHLGSRIIMVAKKNPKNSFFTRDAEQ